MADHSTDQTLTKREYDEIEATIAATERGRLFLHEHAQRNRTAETDVILDALSRLEPQDTNEAAGDRFQAALIEIRDAFAQAKSDLDTLRTGVIGEDGNAVSIADATKSATAGILSAALAVQELAWTMREEGVDEAVCETLDRHATEIFTCCSSHDLVSDHTQRATELLQFVDARLIDVLGPYTVAQATTTAEDDAEIGSDALPSNEAMAADSSAPQENGTAVKTQPDGDAADPGETVTDDEPPAAKTEATATLRPPPPYDPSKPVPAWNALQARGKTEPGAVENPAQETDSEAQPFAQTGNDYSSPDLDSEHPDSETEPQATPTESAADSVETAPIAPSYPPPVAPEMVAAYDDLPDEPLDPRVESALAGLEDAIDAELARSQGAASTESDGEPSPEEPVPTAAAPDTEPQTENIPANDTGPVVETIEATSQPNEDSNVEPLPVVPMATSSPDDAPGSEADDTEAEPDGRDTVVKASLKAVNAWSNGRKIAFFS